LFLKIFLGEMRQDEERDPPAIWARVQEDFKRATNMALVPWWCKLFDAVEPYTRDDRLAARRAHLTPRQPDARPYIVRTSDLVSLAAAVRTADRPGRKDKQSGNLPTVPDVHRTLQGQWLEALRA
jgi:hypothetical protein